MTELGSRWRLALSLTGLMLAMVGLGVRLAFLHLGEHERTRKRAQQVSEVARELIAGRGNIYDCRGRENILALTVAVKDVCADPRTIVRSNCVADVASHLSERFNMPADELAVRLKNPDKRFAYVQRFVPEEEAESLRQERLPGVFFEEQIIRHYPLRQFMCHVLGFVNQEGVGSAGVELRADQYLRGCPGLVENRMDALRQVLYWDEGRYIAPIKGANVTLTLDQNVQFIVEQALDRAMEEHNAKGAWAIVQRVRTGEILAMASRPGFDPNDFKSATSPERLNRAIGYTYEPGSTFKVVAFCGALNEGLVTPGTTFDCEMGQWFHAGRILRDFHPYGVLTTADGLKKSSNILTAKLALRLGEQRFYRYLQAFRFGQRHGLDLPGEETGILHPVSKWSKLSISRIPIGQGIAVTALQMANLYCTIANDGVMMKPYLIREITGNDGTVLYRRQPEKLGRCLRADTAALMRALLLRVTEPGGTGTKAQVEGYEVAGKTGTAQKPEAGGYSPTDYVATFVGFLPAGDPEIGLVVVVDTPQPVHLGGVVAGPVFASIAEQTVRYLDIPPGRTATVALR